MKQAAEAKNALLTVHDFGLTADEAQVWGGLGRTPETYVCVDGLSAQDSALVHIVRLLADRGDLTRARQYASEITDPMARKGQLGLLPPVDA
ncbi:MAG: hypothetical protein ACOYXR_10060 [Nitrospirota bacterium]